MKIYLIKIEAEIPDEKDLYDIIEEHLHNANVWGSDIQIIQIA